MRCRVIRESGTTAREGLVRGYKLGNSRESLTLSRRNRTRRGVRNTKQLLAKQEQLCVDVKAADLANWLLPLVVAFLL